MRRVCLAIPVGLVIAVGAPTQVRYLTFAYPMSNDSYEPLALRAARVVLTRKGRPLNEALAGTGQAALAFSVLFWLGMLVSSRM